MNIPDFVPIEDWKVVVEYSVLSGVNCYLIVAIGWHETQWGRLGWGRYGFHLGVGCFNERQADYTFQGLINQVKWATDKISMFLPFFPSENSLVTFAEKVWRPGNPRNWGKAVYKYFQDFLYKYGQDMFNYVAPPEWVRSDLVDFFKRGLLNTPYGDLTFYRCVKLISNVLKNKVS